VLFGYGLKFGDRKRHRLRVYLFYYAFEKLPHFDGRVGVEFTVFEHAVT